MSQKSDSRQYRIGDFARYMGVTPNFLKHYEEQGLLQTKQSPAGYRFYDFHQSARILDYIRMRNCGVPLKDMRKMLEMDGAHAIELLDGHVEGIKKRIEFETAMLKEHERFKRWYADRQKVPVDWEVRQIQAQYFLPHTKNLDFIEDERIQEVLQAWLDWMPIVKSGMRIDALESDESIPLEWGLIVRESEALRHGLPINDAVIKVPSCKAFVYHFAGNGEKNTMEDIAARSHPIYARMTALGLKPAGNFYMIVDMKYSDFNGERQSTYGRFLVPLK